ncbi:hypothetical protein TIFTF001_022086 [Ficus carica]|uniref:V-SNARE coiled-coil homology domain-containing protein n=1 Tax=Ficus carica TaxID=3494 RepID=A0AA88DF78_FICCA|nr:hypothetical protein TIFTF001_022086 [Ficus carica]
MAIHLYKTSTPSTRKGAVDSQVKSNPRNNLIYGQHHCGKSRNTKGIITAGHSGGATRTFLRRTETSRRRPFTAPSSDLRRAISRPLPSHSCAGTISTVPSAHRCLLRGRQPLPVAAVKTAVPSQRKSEHCCKPSPSPVVSQQLGLDLLAVTLGHEDKHYGPTWLGITAVIVGRQEMWRGRAIWDTVQDFHALTGIPITSPIISLIIGSEDKAVEASQYVAPAHQLILPRDMVEEKLQQQSKLKEHMQYCVDHPEEISKLAKVKAQVSEVKGVMMENIEKVLDRGEKIELLVDKTENLPTSFHLSIFNCFGNEEWQKKSKVSSENHSKNPARYLGGSRSIVQHLDEVHNIHSSSDSNTSGGYFEVFKKTHWSDLRGWTIERAKEDYRKIYSQVLSSAWYEKYGFKRGIGPVPRQASHGSKSGRPRYESLQNEVREGKLRMADMKY